MREMTAIELNSVMSSDVLDVHGRFAHLQGWGSTGVQSALDFRPADTNKLSLQRGMQSAPMGPN